MLSKSKYLSYLKHPAWLWFEINDKKQLPPVSESLQSRFDEGNLFEYYAEQLFPDALKLEWHNYKDYLTLPERTQKAIEEGASAILQGRIEADGLTCIFDALERVNENKFNLYEIKGSTQVKNEHIDDLAFQLVTLEKYGLKVNQIYVIHVDNTYERYGEIEPEGITQVEEVTQKVKDKRAETEANIEEALKIASRSSPPSLSPRYASKRGFGEWMEVFHYMRPHLDKYSIYNLPGLDPALTETLEDERVSTIQEISKDFSLPTKSLGYINLSKSDEPVIEKEEIKDFLESFEYPLYFLDYETYGSVIPPYEGMRPYQQIPFQYSLHKISEPDAEVEHFEYLHTEDTNPAKELTAKLEKDIGEKGTVLVWSESFEKKCNNTLADFVPEKSEFLSELNERIEDLIIPFSRGWYRHKDFFTKSSIKSVLPVLVPELSYKELEVSDGETAQILWAKTILKGENKERREEIIKNLLEYCKLDTKAMVEIWRVLKKTAE